jgi:hypothetical protein
MARRSLGLDLAGLSRQLANNAFWSRYLSAHTDIGMHLAVFTQPLLEQVLEGRKTIEARFSRVRCAPWGEVQNGDCILLKQAGGPVCGMALVENVRFFNLAHEPIEWIREAFGDRICAGEDFWGLKQSAQYATILQITQAIAVDPFGCEKKDRRGWVVLRSRQLELML